MKGRDEHHSIVFQKHETSIQCKQRFQKQLVASISEQKCQAISDLLKNWSILSSKERKTKFYGDKIEAIGTYSGKVSFKFTLHLAVSRSANQTIVRLEQFTSGEIITDLNFRFDALSSPGNAVVSSESNRHFRESRTYKTMII